MQSKSADKPWGIWCRDMYIPADFASRDWRETGFRFDGRRRTLTTAVVCHWTGGEGPPGAVYNTLLNHKSIVTAPDGQIIERAEPLSIHFVVDKDGIVYQMADTELRASHCAAHGLNSLSIGIEFINRGSALDVPARGAQRELVTEVIHDRKTKYWEMTVAQLRAGVKLTRTLCNLYGLPYRVPTDAAGEPVLYALPDSKMRVYTGVLGHAHAERKKLDPGLGILRAIHEAAHSAA